MGSKIAKKWENLFDQNVSGPCKGAAGACKGVAGSLQGCHRGLVRVPQVGAAYQVRHPCKDPGTFWSNTLFHFLAIFDPTEP